MPSPIFISYARRDQAVADAVAMHLKALERQGIAEIWFDQRLELGESWEDRIVREIQRARLVLLLVTPAYLASEFVTRRELPLIEEAGRKGTRVVPVIAASCAWRGHPYIGRLQAHGQGRELKAPTTITFGKQAAALVEELARLIRRDVGEPGSHTRPAEAAPASRRQGCEGRSSDTLSRADDTGSAVKGSQRQVQVYVNTRQKELESAIRAASPSLPDRSTITWRSPLAQDRFAEYRDAAFLQRVEHPELSHRLREFWPARGPRWDALATVEGYGADNEPGVLLLEGKSYAAELWGVGAKASPASRERILRALAWTQQMLGVRADPEIWLGRGYQFANRLAHLAWLRQLGLDAWLVHLLFVDDPHHPTGEREWDWAIRALHAELRLDQRALDHVSVVLLPALDREVLADPG